MSYEKRFSDWEERVKTASVEANSASAAAALLGIKFTTYKKYALQYGCYETNKGGKGTSKPKQGIPLVEILDGLHPQYQSNKLRIRLIKEEVLPAKCNNCKLDSWLGEPIPLELDHIDGDNSNHKLENLNLLCPNCHTLTPTYRGKNKGLII